MQLVGIALLAFIVWLGFTQKSSNQAISAFDLHALVMVVVGSVSAVLIGSSAKTAVRTLTCLRELVPALGRFRKATASLEADLREFYSAWREGRRGQALAAVERSGTPTLKAALELSMSRAPAAAVSKAFLELRHAEVDALQPAIHNWEMLSKLGPAFGMVGTITGMIQLFKNMSAENLNIGASMSLALLATLYGVAFGAGMAGPISHFLNGLLDERLGFLDRCEQSVNELVARGGA